MSTNTLRAFVGCQDLHHFWLYTFVPHQADLSSLGSQARKILLQRGGIFPHRLSNPPTHALYALGACMSIPLLHTTTGGKGGKKTHILLRALFNRAR